MNSFISLLIFGFQITAAPAGRSTQGIFDSMQALIPKMCMPASTLMVCFSGNKETCDGRVASAFETCLRDQKIKYAGQTILDDKNANDAETNLKSCVLKSYAMAAATSYRKSADCDKWVPVMKKPAKAATVSSAQTTALAFEDPLDHQRDLVGRYKLRVLHDVRLITQFKDDMQNRKTCINDKLSRESNINCFKRALAKFEITSSSQVPLLLVVATSMANKDRAEGFAWSNGTLIDVTLSVNERVQIERFHLSLLEAASDTDRMILDVLRSDDEKLLKSINEKIYAVLKAKLNERSTGREPANMTTIKMRLEAIKSSAWVYAKIP